MQQGTELEICKGAVLFVGHNAGTCTTNTQSKARG